MNPLRRINSFRVALLAGLCLAQTLMAPPAGAACQNASCWLPNGWILSSPLDFSARLENVFEPTGGAEGASPSETFLNPTASRIERPGEDGYVFRSAGVQLGGLRQIAPDTFAVFALAYEDSRQRTNDGLTQTNSRHYSANLAAVREWEPWRAYVSVTLAHSRHRMWRRLIPDARAATARSKVGTYQGSLGAGVSYRLEHAGWYFEPGLGLALLYERTPGYRETGLGGDDQHVKRDESLRAMLMPTMEVGGQARLGGMQLVYWASAGLSLIRDNTWKMRSHTAGQPGIELISTETMPSAIGMFEIGAMLASDRGWSLLGQYGWLTGYRYRGHSGALRLAWTF